MVGLDTPPLGLCSHRRAVIQPLISIDPVDPPHLSFAKILTLLAMHSCNALAESLHAPMLFRSLLEAQQASMDANSVAQGAAAASFFGRTLSLFNFILGCVVW